MLYKFFFILFYLFFAISVKAKMSNCLVLKDAKEVPLKYAQLFKIKFDEKNKITFVGLKRKAIDLDYKWWALSSDVDKFKKYSKECTEVNFKAFPKRAITTSTTHLSFIADIGAEDNLLGFTQTSMITGERWKKRILEKKLENLPLALNVEHFIKGKYDFLLTYPESSFDDLINSLHAKSNLENVTMLSAVEYLESKALARMEWIKFFGAIFNKFDKSVAVFDVREKHYKEVISLVKTQKNYKSKTAMLGEVLDGKWVYPSSNSDFMNLCEDLGLMVIKPKIQSSMRKNIGPDFFHLEEMLSVKNKTDFWIITSAYSGKQDLLKKHPIYRNFTNKSIIALKKDPKMEHGFHGFWEEGINRPDQLILDLASYIYPEIFAKHHSVWFNKLL